MEGMYIRPFTQADRQLVTNFFDQMGGETRFFFNRGDGNRKFAMAYFEGTSEHTDFFLAEYEGQMIGYVFLWDMNTAIPWLGIAVHDAYKGLGVGKKLMEHVIGHAKAHDKGGILLTTDAANVRAQILYERYGFRYMGLNVEKLYLLRF